MSSLRLELPAPVRGRIPALDELKGVAILLVILYHAGGVLVWRDLVHAELGVDIFVILSGIGLALSSRVESSREFLWRRFTRVLPAYWIALAVYTAADIHFLDKHYEVPNLIVHVLGIHAWFGDVWGLAINDSFWFVTLILTLYVIYCFVRPLIAHPDRLLLAAAVICLPPTFLFLHAGQSGIYSHVALRMPGFFVGLLIGRLLRDGKLDLPLTAVGGAALLLLGYVPYTQGVIYNTVPLGLVLMAAYTWLFRPLLQDRARGVLKFLGDHSLEIFLFHQPLIRDFNYYIHIHWLLDPAPSPVSLIVGMLVALAVTLCISVELHALLKRLRLA